MFFKIIKNDFRRKKVVTITVFVFITLAVILGASSTNIIANLIQSMSYLQESAVPADIAQMHIGEIDQSAIDKFTEKQRDNIALQETMALLNFEGANVQYGNNKSLAGTIQDISFVFQNKKFDFILNLDNEKLDVKEGEVAVPSYFMKECNLKIGEKITVVCVGGQKEFVISDYARDFEMSNSFTTSKRFVINKADFDKLAQMKVDEKEFLIEFKLTENGDSNAVQTAYIEAGLPANGPTVEGKIFTMFNAMTDVGIAMIIILISIMLVIIAAICIRLIFLATIDEDLREIGVMKAMGISKKDIKKVYLVKYRTISVAGGIIGYILSFAVVNLFSGNMKLYLSTGLSGNLKYFLSILAPLLVYLMVVSYCKKVLKRIDKISAVEALRSNITDTRKNKKYSFPLLKNKFLSTNIYMGYRDVWKRFKLYRLMILIFSICTFIVIFPINIYNTMNSPDFTTYMGVGKSDMRIDLRRTNTIEEDFVKLKKELKEDLDINKYATYITCSYQIKNNEGAWDYINIETGDFSMFPLTYLEGRAPKEKGEISLSYANADKSGLNKKVEDLVTIRVDGEEKNLKVCGIYQDITNGGKTAKADSSLSLNEDAVLWYITYIDVNSEVNLLNKMEYYQNAFDTALVNNNKEVTKQTLGVIITQMDSIVIGGFSVALIIIILITALFIKMLLSKDMSRIAIMRSMGLTSKNIKHQYMAGTLMVLILGIVLGVLSSNYLGELIASMAMSLMGATRIQFVNVPWQTCLLCPLILIIVVGFTISACCKVTVDKDISVVLRS